MSMNPKVSYNIYCMCLTYSVRMMSCEVADQHHCDCLKLMHTNYDEDNDACDL